MNGNFRAYDVSGVKRFGLIVESNRVGALTIQGKVFEYYDDPIDTPRVPTMEWINWAATRIEFSAQKVERLSEAGNKFKVQVAISFSSGYPEFVISSPSFLQSLYLPVADYILQFVNPGNIDFYWEERIFKHFSQQLQIAES